MPLTISGGMTGTGNLTISGAQRHLHTNPVNITGNIIDTSSGTVSQNIGFTATGYFSQSAGTFNSNTSYTFSIGGSFSIPAYALAASHGIAAAGLI